MRKRRFLSWRVRARVMADSWHAPDQAFICNYCCARLSENDVVIDHITPLARGGSDIIGNLQVTCRRCNSVKSDKSHFEAEEFINQILDAECGGRA